MKKHYVVNIDMKYSEDIRVSSKNKYFAKIAAWVKFIRKVKPKMFNISVDEI